MPTAGTEAHAVESNGQPASWLVRRLSRHSDRCSDCKNVLIDFFRKSYGRVKVDHKLAIPALLSDYKGKPYYEDLARILDGLVRYRGYDDFVGARTLPRCDLYVPDPGFVVEFDESQHFSEARRISLSLYPADLPLGFDRNEWVRLCESTRARDDSPPYRDEQRAWYDTLRDFLPLIDPALGPTVRVHMGAYEWCSLDPDDEADAETLRSKVLFETWPKTSSEPSVQPGRSDRLRIATVVVQTSSGRIPNEERIALLSNIVDTLGISADVVLLPAGFLKAKDRPRSMYQSIVSEVARLAARSSGEPIVCFGIDGRENWNGVPQDQIALAVSARGIVAIARKFHPTKDENGLIDVARSHLSEEDGFSRIFECKGRALFLAVCYDAFGIRQRRLANPGVDAVLNLIHSFHPKGSGGSGEVYFAKHGLAGASRQWKCPVFAAVKFRGREIPENWPTGVLWTRGDKDTQQWAYSDNPLRPLRHSIWVDGPSERALIRVYEV